MTMAQSARSTPPIWVLAFAVSGANVGISLLSPAIPDLRAELITLFPYTTLFRSRKSVV